MVSVDGCGLPSETDPFRQFGLSEPVVMRLLEQLPSAEKCSNYCFKYHKPSAITSWKKAVSCCVVEGRGGVGVWVGTRRVDVWVGRGRVDVWVGRGRVGCVGRVG